MSDLFACKQFDKKEWLNGERRKQKVWNSRWKLFIDHGILNIGEYDSYSFIFIFLYLWITWRHGK